MLSNNTTQNTDSINLPHWKILTGLLAATAIGFGYGARLGGNSASVEEAQGVQQTEDIDPLLSRRDSETSLTCDQLKDELTAMRNELLKAQYVSDAIRERLRLEKEDPETLAVKDEHFERRMTFYRLSSGNVPVPLEVQAWYDAMRKLDQGQQQGEFRLNLRFRPIPLSH